MVSACGLCIQAMESMKLTIPPIIFINVTYPSFYFWGAYLGRDHWSRSERHKKHEIFAEESFWPNLLRSDRWITVIVGFPFIFTLPRRTSAAPRYVHDRWSRSYHFRHMLHQGRFDAEHRFSMLIGVAPVPRPNSAFLSKLVQTGGCNPHFVSCRSDKREIS